MSKTLTAAATLAVLLAPRLAAAEEPRAAALPPTYVAYQLLDRGYDLRRLDQAEGIYAATLRTAEGALVTMGVDPTTGALLPHAFLGRQPSTEDDAGAGPAPAATAATAIEAAALEGHWDIIEFALRGPVWQVAARDDDAVLATINVDAATGTVLTTEHQVARRD